MRLSGFEHQKKKRRIGFSFHERAKRQNNGNSIKFRFTAISFGVLFIWCGEKGAFEGKSN